MYYYTSKPKYSTSILPVIVFSPSLGNNSLGLYDFWRKRKLVSVRIPADFVEISFSTSLYLIVYFWNSLPKILTIYTIEESVLDFYCYPSVLNSNNVEWMFKDSLACIRKFVESDNTSYVECWQCSVLGMWDVRFAGYQRCDMFKMWDVRDVGCWGYGM